VEQAFRDFLRCGCLAEGFARFRCVACGLNRFVAFSIGQIVAWVGAWYHSFWLVPAGYGIVIAAWMTGLWNKRDA
jgi:hypothetical protein